MQPETFPVNYDFGANWEEKIVPLLDHPKIKNAIRRGVNTYLANFPKCKEKYVEGKVPATYSSKDWYCCTFMDRRREELFEQLRRDGEMPKKFLRLERRFNKMEEDDPLYDDTSMLYMQMEDDIHSTYFGWDVTKNELASYVLSGSCFWWAPTFELALAKLVEPDEKWRVRVGKCHATVINKNNTKVFDLLYWASLNGQLENYFFGDPLEKIDPTLGGEQAFLDSTY
jgi:hypothetical protein